MSSPLDHTDACRSDPCPNNKKKWGPFGVVDYTLFLHSVNPKKIVVSVWIFIKM